MASWRDVEAAEPEFATAVRARFDAHKHKTLATLRRDGSPRISGVEAEFRDGELWLGMMEGSRKALDLLRDPRLALHCASEDPPDDDPSRWPGDAKVAGRAVDVSDPDVVRTFANEPGQRFQLFRIDLGEAVLTRVGSPPDHLVIELWREGAGLGRMQRR